MVAWLPCTSDLMRWPSYALSLFSLIESHKIVLSDLASYPGLLTPAFVACITDGRPGKTESRAMIDVPGCVEEWHFRSVRL